MPRWYRIVLADPPTAADFLPQGKLGKTPLRPMPPDLADSWNNAISVFDTEDAARTQARAFPRLGEYIAEMETNATDPIVWEQTGRDPHHYDLRGQPGAFLSSVIRVIPVRMPGPPAQGDEP